MSINIRFYKVFCIAFSRTRKVCFTNEFFMLLRACYVQIGILFGSPGASKFFISHWFNKVFDMVKCHCVFSMNVKPFWILFWSISATRPPKVSIKERFPIMYLEQHFCNLPNGVLPMVFDVLQSRKT